MTSEAKSTKRRCPRCLHDRVQWSHSVGVEHLARFLCIGFYRCKHCKSRFPGFRRWGQRQIRFAILFLGVLGAFAFVWLAIQYLNSA